MIVASSLETLQGHYQVAVEWHSYMLRPPGTPPIDNRTRAWFEQKSAEFRAMALERFGLKIRQGPFGIDSLPALIGEKYAELHGKGKEYHRAVQDAYWFNAENIEEQTVLRRLAESVGLDGDDFLAALNNPALHADVMRDMHEAVMMGIRGVPALIFQRKFLVSGAQPYDVLAQVVEEIEQGHLDGS